MDKKIKVLYIITILLISGLPVLSMPFINVETTNNEKRELSSFPDIYKENKINIEFFNEFNEYLLDNFNFRSQMVEINTIVQEKLFGISAESQVILGENDWLYFDKTVDDYSRRSTLSDLEIQKIKQCLSLINEYVTLNGSDFRFTIAPNKNSIYPENMPYNYMQMDTKSNLELLEQELDQDVYINMFQILSGSKEQVYLKRDSHWNNLGAYIGFQEILRSFNLEIDFEIIGEEIKREFEADLENMLHPTGSELDEQVYYTFDRDFDYTSRFKTMDDLSITTVCEDGKSSIMVYRDSFGNALLDYFARQFSEVEFSRIVPYRLDKGIEYDYVLLEVVERNIPNLLDSAPVMEAIIREDIVGNVEVHNPNIIIEESQGYYHIFGYAQDVIEVPYSVYMEYEGICYELFPILESSIENVYRNDMIVFSGYIESVDVIEIEDIKITYRKL